MRSRALSDVLAFTIIFSVIITSVALVYTAGFGGLVDLQEGEQSRNAERAFEALTRNLDDVQRSHAIGRAGEINAGGGSLQIANGSTIFFATNDTRYNRTLMLRSLRYELGETAIVYQGGALMRQDGDRTVMLDEPTILCSENRAVVSVVTLQRGSSDVGSQGTVQIVAREQSQRLLYPNSRKEETLNVDEVRVAVNRTENEAVWNDYFDDAPGWTHDGNGVYVCNTDRVYLRQTTVRIQFVT